MHLRKLLLAVLMSCSIGIFAQKDLSQGSVPNWVKPVSIFANVEISLDESSFAYLQEDKQFNIATEENFYHLTYKILSVDGIQNMSDISINYDPEFQKVQIHHIDIIRDGRKINKLDLNDIQMIQREENMERHLYDGSLTAVINLTDVRVNDLIEYSYTTTGFNPAHSGKFSNWDYLNYTIGIKNIHHRYLIPEGEFIKYEVFNSDFKPEIGTFGNMQEYIFNVENPEKVSYDSNYPNWFSANAYYEITQFRDWKDLTQTYMKFYDFKGDYSKFKVSAANIHNKNGQADKVTSLIQFVQDEIRYLGFENGLSSHKPKPPSEVLKKRFGDCKDKSFLLASLLNSIGVEAKPVLVNSEKGKTLPEGLASPYAFDHCIVQYETDSGIRYVDPTISNQGGKSTSIYFPNYTYGLVLSPDTKELTKLKNPSESGTDITETFILDSINGSATLKVETIYKGSKADLTRTEFLSNDISTIQDNYLSYYRSNFSNINSSKAITYEDRRNEDNTFLVEEEYVIPDFWFSANDEDPTIYAEFYALPLHDYLNPEQNDYRQSPYFLDEDVNLDYHMVIFVPEAWNVEADKYEFENDFFSYSYFTQYDQARIDVQHKFRQISDHVAADDYKDYVESTQLAAQNLTFQLSYNGDLAVSSENSDFSWLTLALILVIMGLSIYFAFKIYYNFDLPSKVKKRDHRNSIGGWLILIAIGLCFTPIMNGYQLFFTEYLSPVLWNLFNTPEYELYAWLTIVEIIYSSVTIVFSVLLIFLFFRRRTILPRLIIIFWAMNLIFLLLDLIASYTFINTLSELEKTEVVKEFAKAAFRCIIWIPYFMMSKRVEETFVYTASNHDSHEIITSEEISGALE